MRSRIYSVAEVEVGFTLGEPNGPPPAMVVTAKGQVASTGWKDGALDMWFYIDKPADGVIDFDFTAEQPEGIVNPALIPIESTPLVMEIPDWVRGVRVHATTNSVEELFDRGKPATTKGGDPTPWPWAPGTALS